jgi:hypothetical protein
MTITAPPIYSTSSSRSKVPAAKTLLPRPSMKTCWVPGVNNLGTHGRWAFAEFCHVYEIESDFAAKVGSHFDQMIHAATSPLISVRRSLPVRHPYPRKMPIPLPFPTRHAY